MAKQVIWSQRAQANRKEILEYWTLRNKSNSYSKKLNNIFKEAIKLISDFPKIGKKTDDPQLRIKVVRDYQIIYEIAENSIFVLTIWDNRQDPQKLEKIINEK